ncbi:MAG: enoyl-CoA hydratase [Candidatus Dadabacteria bacterium]|nr:MAG: enoyl-CoA hydratase [Candidatus Dadabacteria bacterium]
MKDHYDFIRVETRDRIMVLTINRPEVMNAIHPPASREMAEAFDEFVADPNLWVAIVTGAGDRAFSAGNDLKYQAAGGDMSWPPSGFGGLTSRFDCNKPIIAAVNGIALGGGFEIALACDIIIAARRARFGLPEPRVGLAALAGGMHRLPRQVGLKNAMALLLTGRQIDAAEAYRIGLVQEIAEDEAVLERALAWAAEICECAPLSVRATKQAALGGLDRPLAEAMKMDFPALREMFASEDFLEGPRAFAEKRKPQWKGR